MTHKWTFMVYMAGDNGAFFEGKRLMSDLQAHGWQDIAEMASIGSNADVAVVVQYDTLDEKTHTPRFYIQPAADLDRESAAEHLVGTVPPVNTGDPQNLSDFIVWAIREYPAEHYALVLWSHGSGWKEDDIYARYRERVERAIHGGETRSGGGGERLMRRALFLPTAGEIMGVQDDEVRAICYDDSSMDFLDNYELEKALRDAQLHTGIKLDLLGMDACLMGMVEVAYQVYPYADFMVASQEIEQADGWPYGNILGDLAIAPGMPTRELSQVIVERFRERYSGFTRDAGGVNTLSAVDLGVMPQTFSRIKALAALLNDAYARDVYTELAVLRAQQDAERFRDIDYLDLRHLVSLIEAEYGGALQVRDLAYRLAEHLGAPDGPVVANFRGPGHPNANGLSIYFPARRYSPFYDRQVFARSGWPRVIRRANRMHKPRLSAPPGDLSAGGKATRGIGTRQLSCPICDCEIEVPTSVDKTGLDGAARGLRDLAMAIQGALDSPTSQDEQWIDLACPNCRHVFQYNTLSGETSP